MDKETFITILVFPISSFAFGATAQVNSILNLGPSGTIGPQLWIREF